ncbi:hypothetical protein PPROV_000334600 [Pycnococcus provasolii]|uniref:Anaphase-promoting complex subunit 4 WD40 domain-containing protein n=2 Tax=Pycnococcus provasolii TaxID=41880 RepID=A0A830HD53_9CHLO|nr:hypothetical protein PPROV_000334600 [Pycnococcus provasolii]
MAFSGSLRTGTPSCHDHNNNDFPTSSGAGADGGGDGDKNPRTRIPYRPVTLGMFPGSILCRPSCSLAHAVHMLDVNTHVSGIPAFHDNSDTTLGPASYHVLLLVGNHAVQAVRIYHPHVDDGNYTDMSSLCDNNKSDSFNAASEVSVLANICGPSPGRADGEGLGECPEESSREFPVIHDAAWVVRRRRQLGELTKREDHQNIDRAVGVVVARGERLELYAVNVHDHDDGDERRRADAASLVASTSLPYSATGVAAVDANDDDVTIFVGSLQGTHAYRLQDGTLVCAGMLAGAPRSVCRLTASPDGFALAVASLDGKAAIYALPQAERVLMFRGVPARSATGLCTCLSWGGGGAVLACASWEGGVVLVARDWRGAWNVVDIVEGGTSLPGGAGCATCLAWGGGSYVTSVAGAWPDDTIPGKDAGVKGFVCLDESRAACWMRDGAIVVRNMRRNSNHLMSPYILRLGCAWYATLPSMGCVVALPLPPSCTCDGSADDAFDGIAVSRGRLAVACRGSAFVWRRGMWHAAVHANARKILNVEFCGGGGTLDDPNEERQRVCCEVAVMEEQEQEQEVVWHTVWEEQQAEEEEEEEIVQWRCVSKERKTGGAGEEEDS